MKDQKLSAFTIGNTIVGVVVGAGFASGQEVLRFFTVFEHFGLLGIIVSTFCFILLSYMIMRVGASIGAKSHLEVIQYTTNKKLVPWFDYFITTLLFFGYIAMLAGTGAFIHQVFGINVVIGILFMGLITLFTVLLGIDQVISSISFVVPFLLIGVLSISLMTLFKDGSSIQHVVVTKSFLNQNWFISSLLYVSYNMTFATSILAPLGAKGKSKKSLLYASIYGGMSLGILSFMIYLTTSTHIMESLQYEIPMLYFAFELSKKIGIVYAMILIAEIYTTSVGSFYGLVARLFYTKKRNHSLVGIIVLAIFGGIFALFGFSDLVQYLYPVEGYLSLFLFLTLLVSYIYKKRI